MSTDNTPKTLVVQIGNTDNKLTQQQWAEFCRLTHSVVSRYGALQFSGGSATDAAWQNYCWVLSARSMDGLRTELAVLAHQFKQESIALTVGDTQFIKPSDR